MLEKILNLIFPIKCEQCGILGKYVCEKCYQELKKYELKNNDTEKFFLYRYEDEIRKKLIKYKFNGSGYLCNFFSTCILNNENACKFINSYDVIVPVPLHKKRKNERGYNQSELITKRVAKGLHIPINTQALIKIKNTKPQSMKKLESRVNSVKGAYCVKNMEEIKGKKLLILDDIYTTGSTYNECKKMLLNAGAEDVGVFTIAKDFMK